MLSREAQSRRRRAVLAHACPGCRAPWAVRAVRNSDGGFLLICRFCDWRDVRRTPEPAPVRPPRGADAPEQHVVIFPESEQELLTALVDHVVAGLTDGRPCLVLATQAHRAALAQAMAERGVASEGLLCLDAQQTLALFVRDGRPDPLLFDASVGALVRDAVDDGRPVQAYGEMVALLWQAGDVVGALELEQLWNRLAERIGLSLLCAYPAELLADDPVGREQVRACHTSHRAAPAAPRGSGRPARS